MCNLSRDTVDDILARGKIYEVGGAVRDRLMSATATSQDRDYLVTGIDYDSLTELLRKHGRVDLVGKSFGVIKFTQFRQGVRNTFDIALPRREHSTGWGHREFEVAFDPELSVEDDLVRRDFTINAMAVALDSDEIIDPFGGREDLKRRHLRMVYEDSFEDDPLRMIRAVQFAARFKFEIEPATFAAMKRCAHKIATVSAERINEELNKLLRLAEKPSQGFRLMLATGLLKEVLPELEECVGVDQPGGYHKYDVFEHTMYAIDASPAVLRVRMAALFHDITKPQAKRPAEKGATFYGHERSGARVAEHALGRLRYSRDFIRQVITLVERHMFTTQVTDKGMRRLLRRVGPDLIFDLLDLRRADVQAMGMGGSTEDVDEFEADVRAELSRKPPLSVSDLALNGTDLMQMLKIGPGPKVGEILKQLLEKVLDEPELNRQETLQSLARSYYESNPELKDKNTDKESDL